MPISEMIVIALSRLTPGMVQRNWTAFSKSVLEEIIFSIILSTSLIFGCDIIHMCADKAHTVFGHQSSVSFDGFYNSIFFGLRLRKKF